MADALYQAPLSMCLQQNEALYEEGYVLPVPDGQLVVSVGSTLLPCAFSRNRILL